MMTVKVGEVVSISVDGPRRSTMQFLRLSEVEGGISAHRQSKPTANMSRRLRKGLLSE